jgi:hypothetical protein
VSPGAPPALMLPPPPVLPLPPVLPPLLPMLLRSPPLAKAG